MSHVIITHVFIRRHTPKLKTPKRHFRWPKMKPVYLKLVPQYFWGESKVIEIKEPHLSLIWFTFSSSSYLVEVFFRHISDSPWHLSYQILPRDIAKRMLVDPEWARLFKPNVEILPALRLPGPGHPQPCYQVHRALWGGQHQLLPNRWEISTLWFLFS